MVQDSAHHLLSLINDVLDLSKIEAGRTGVKAYLMKPFVLRDLARTIRQVLVDGSS